MVILPVVFLHSYKPVSAKIPVNSTVAFLTYSYIEKSSLYFMERVVCDYAPSKWEDPAVRHVKKTNGIIKQQREEIIIK